MMVLLVLLAVTQPIMIPREQYTLLRERQELSVLSLAQISEFRTLVTGVDSNTEAENVRDYMNDYIDEPFSVQVCDENNDCYGSLPSQANYTLVSYLMDGNTYEFSLKKLKVYFWVFEAGD